MTHRLITTVRKANVNLKSVLFFGNFNSFSKLQPKRLELRQFLSQLSSYPPKGFDKPLNQRNGNKNGACMAGGISTDRNSSSLSGGADGREEDEEKSKVGPGSGGKNNSLLDRSNTDSKWAALAKKLELIDETVEKISNVPVQEINDDENEKESVPAHLAELVNGAKSTDPRIRYCAVNSVRKLLTSSRHPSIHFLISCNILPTLVDCLRSPNPFVQFDALVALTKVVEGTSEQTQAVVEAGAVSHFLRLLTSPDQNIFKHSLSALERIIITRPHLRNDMINKGVVAPLLNCIEPDTPLNFLRALVPVISILCLRSGKPLPPQTVREILPTLNVLVHHIDPVVLLISVSALMFLTQGGKEQIQMVIDSGVLPNLVQLLNHEQVEVQEVAAGAVWKIVNGSNGEMQSGLNCDALSHFRNLLNQPKHCKWALEVLAMVSAKNFATVQAIINAKLIPLIVHHLEKGELETQKGAAWAVRCMTIRANKEQVAHFIDCGVIPPLCNLLNSNDAEVVLEVLDGIHNILLVMTVNQDSLDSR